MLVDTTMSVKIYIMSFHLILYLKFKPIPNIKERLFLPTVVVVLQKVPQRFCNQPAVLGVVLDDFAKRSHRPPPLGHPPHPRVQNSPLVPVGREQISQKSIRDKTIETKGVFSPTSLNQD